MYYFHQTSHPATTVEHSIQCNLYNLNESNLVLAGANQLQVFRFIRFPNTREPDVIVKQETKQEKQEEIEENEKKTVKEELNEVDNEVANEVDTEMDDNEEEDKVKDKEAVKIEKELEKEEEEEDKPEESKKSKPQTIFKKPEESVCLEFVQSFELYGSVASLQKISLGSKSTYKRDALAISFHDAKLSIVEYNPETHDLKTVSMHYFEDDNLRDGCVTNHMFAPIVRVDPENRCIAMLIYGRHIVVIPVDKEEEEDLDHELYNKSTSSESSSGSASEDEDCVMKPSSLFQNGLIQKPVAGKVAALKPALTPSFKSPVLTSYKIDLSEEICGEKIDNIVDIQFLHNYNDPTLVILHEPWRTWSGRVAMRQDTFSMVALSMNVHQHVQPIIWTVNNLPYDCFRILPVPKPIGGLLVLACNELIYLNQSVPAFGITFNAFSKDSSAFPFNNQENASDQVNYTNISFDLSQAVFLNHNKILFILKDGDVYLVTLFNDDMRSIKDFHFEHIASTVQPNCLTLCENNLLFIGSHVGDSLLTEVVGDLKSSCKDIYDADEMDSLLSNDEREPVHLYEHDKLVSSSASGRIIYGEAPNISENMFHSHRDPFIELIVTAGQHKNGSVCAFQRTIRPQVTDTYELKDCSDLYILNGSKNCEDKLGPRLILSREYETLVFSTKGELLELKRDECAYDLNEPTIYATNIGEDNLAIQVLSSSIRLVSDDKLIHLVKIEGKICDICVADPHIIALTENGTIHHLQLISSSDSNENGKRQFGLSCYDIGTLTNGQIISLTLYKDLSGLFTCKNLAKSDSSSTSSPAPNLASYWLLVVDNRGVLEIFSVPDFNVVYSVDNFPSAPAVLADNIKLFVTDLDSAIAKTKEILVCGMGRDKRKPILFVRSDSELVVYDIFRFTDVDINNHLKIRFKKIGSTLLNTISPPPENAIEPAHHMIEVPMETAETNGIGASGHYHSSSSSKSHRSSRHHNHQLERRGISHNRRWLREFHNIGGYSGVFLSGYRPHWFIMTDRGALRSHPMTVEGAVHAFSSYDNNDFIYFTEHRELRIARLANSLSLDSQWPLRKLDMKETVHFVNYHVERKVYCVVTSSPVPCLKLMKVGSEPDTMKIEDIERENGYISYTTEKFRLRIYDPENWEQVPDCEIEFEEWEQVTCVKNVLLASEGTTSGLKGYIAISTNYCYGEDVPNRGRIWILDLIEVVPEPDRPLTKNKIKKVYCQEQKGPVTTLSHTCGLLMSAVGQKIYLWQLKEEQLDGVAFIDTQVYIHCAASVKNLILVSDVCKSVSLLRYQQGTRTLSMVCRDSKPLEVFACDFTVDNELLNFVVTDSEKNIIIYAHDPEHEESYGGTRLLRRADYHLGSHVISFCRLRAKVPSIFANRQHEALYYRRRHITMFCTVDGGIGFLFPVDESVHRRFQMLQNEMTVALPHVAGLNPKAWRAVKQARPSITTPCKHILDGDLINRFLMLSVKERNELTKKIGTTTDRILADIQLIQESTLYS